MRKFWTQCAMAFSLQLILNRLQQTCMIQRAVCWFFLKCMFIYFFRDWADDKIMWENGKTFHRVKVWSHLLLLDKISWVKRRCCHNFASNLSKRTCILLDKIIYSCILLIKKILQTMHVIKTKQKNIYFFKGRQTIKWQKYVATLTFVQWNFAGERKLLQQLH